MVLTKEEAEAKREQIIKEEGEEYYNEWLKTNAPEGGYTNSCEEGSSNEGKERKNEKEEEDKAKGKKSEDMDTNAENSRDKTVENDKGNDGRVSIGDDIVCPVCEGDLELHDDGLLYCAKCDDYYTIEETEETE